MNVQQTVILVYAHNASSPFHVSAKAFVESVMNNRFYPLSLVSRNEEQ
jgi:hypothetical protein